MHILVKVKVQILTWSPSYMKALPFQRIAIAFAINIAAYIQPMHQSFFLYVFILFLLLFLTVIYVLHDFCY